MSVEQAKPDATATVTALTENHIDNPAYTPAVLLDTMLERMGLKNDAALARTLELPPPVVSKIRHKQASVTAAILLRIHDVTRWPVNEIRALMGITPQFQSL